MTTTVFSVRIAFRILRRDGNAAENSQVVKFSLRFHDRAFAQRLSGVNPHFARDHARPAYARSH